MNNILEKKIMKKLDKKYFNIQILNMKKLNKLNKIQQK